MANLLFLYFFVFSPVYNTDYQQNYKADTRQNMKSYRKPKKFCKDTTTDGTEHLSGKMCRHKNGNNSASEFFWRIFNKNTLSIGTNCLIKNLNEKVSMPHIKI